MGFFDRKPKVLEPVPTRLDMAWFRSWTIEIIRASGVDPSDDANGIALIHMAPFPHFSGSYPSPI